MSGRVWERFLTTQDKAHLAARGTKAQIGFGTHAVVLSIDNYRAALGDGPQPLLESVSSWPRSTGEVGWEAVGHIATLLAEARESAVPVVHITGLPEAESSVRSWAKPNAFDVDASARERLRDEEVGFEIVPEAAPVAGEAVMRKTAPSAFFGTPLMGHLNGLGVDTLVVCGESTSGCVRATVVDGCSYRFRVIVVEECVYDRHESAHAMNLFDMDQKYADVLPLDHVCSWIRDQRRVGSSAGA